MATDRCPSCGAAVRAGDAWCTLCWTDLRPKPEPVVAPPAPVVAPAVVPAPVRGYGVDPLTAPLDVLLATPLVADPGAPSSATWPCVECGAPNALDLDACHVCTTPFGGRVARIEDVKAAKRAFLLKALAAVGAFLAVLALVTFALTDTSNITPEQPTHVEIPAE